MLKPDHWIRKQDGMIDPFVGAKVREAEGRRVVLPFGGGE